MKENWKNTGGFIFGVIIACVIVGSLFVGCSRTTQDTTKNDVQNINDTDNQIQQRDLVIGTQGADVWDLHQQLYELMPNDVTQELATTDEFNETTQFYVTLFQLSQDLEPNGVVDTDTRVVLANNPIIPPEEDLNILKSTILIDEDNENVTKDDEKVVTGKKIAYLTFDDGPSPKFTPQIVELLEQYDASATFFVLGQEVDKFPEIAKEVSANNQVVANHTYSHINIETASDKVVQDEITQANQAVKNATNRTPICFRPPYGAMRPETREKIGNVGGKTIMWDVDTQDWARPGANEIAEHILEYVQNGEVVLMHDGGGDRTQTIEAMKIFLPKMVADGWEFRALDCVR